jgi:hypothetical protein
MIPIRECIKIPAELQSGTDFVLTVRHIAVCRHGAVIQIAGIQQTPFCRLSGAAPARTAGKWLWFQENISG